MTGTPVGELWRLLDEVQQLAAAAHSWDPSHALGALSDIIERVRIVAADPLGGSKGEIEAAAGSWARIGEAMDGHAAQLRAMDVATVWSGSAARDCAATIERLAARYDDAAALAEAARTALLAYAQQVTIAQRRYDEMGTHLEAAAAGLRPCLPHDLAPLLQDLGGRTAEAIRAAVDGYAGADAATHRCELELARVGERMPFPPGQVPGRTAFELMDAHSESSSGAG